jgi:hypothetical protein
MRTLKSLRETCQDNGNEYRLVLSDSIQSGVYYNSNNVEIEIMNGDGILIPKGYYIITYNIAFAYDQSGDFGIITPSSFHNNLDYKYSDYKEADNNPIQFYFNIE